MLHNDVGAPACLKMVFSELFEAFIPHILILEQVHDWIPGQQNWVKKAKNAKLPLDLQRHVLNLNMCLAYSSHSFLTVVIAPSFHSLVFFFVLVRGTAFAGAT